MGFRAKALFESPSTQATPPLKATGLLQQSGNFLQVSPRWQHRHLRRNRALPTQSSPATAPQICRKNTEPSQNLTDLTE